MIDNFGMVVRTSQDYEQGTIAVMLYGSGSHAAFNLPIADAEKLAREILKQVAKGNESASCSHCGKPADTIACGVGGCPLGGDL
jgi:hypothetical protein